MASIMKRRLCPISFSPALIEHKIGSIGVMSSFSMTRMYGISCWCGLRHCSARGRRCSYCCADLSTMVDSFDDRSDVDSFLDDVHYADLPIFLSASFMTSAVGPHSEFR